MILFTIFFLLPALCAFTDKRHDERKEQERMQRMLSEEMKRAKRWG